MNGLQMGLLQFGAYLLVIVLGFAIINFLTKGFLWEYLRVKLSRGRLILIKCHDSTDSYYKACKIDSKKNLKVKDRAKNIYTFSNIDRMLIGRELGVNIIEVDLIKQIVINKDFTEATAYDLTAADDMVNRAAMLPKLGQDLMSKEMIIAIITLILVIGVGIIVLMQPDMVADKIAEKVAQKMLGAATGGNI